VSYYSIFVITPHLANLLNSNQVELRGEKSLILLLHEVVDPKQLLLQEEHLLTINKVSISQ
jgi:hypothetical protein